MRYAFTIPTVESMSRKAPRPEKALTAEEVLAQNQRERSARQSGRRRLSPAASKKHGSTKRDPKSNGGDKASESVEDVESGGEGSGSESEDGYLSSSSSGSVDRREPGTVRNDVLSEILGASGASNKTKPVGKEQSSGATSSTSLPKDLKPESHEHIVYLAGNSLGLQSKSSYQLVNEELVMWQTKWVLYNTGWPPAVCRGSQFYFVRAVTGWFNSHHDRPWKSYAEDITAMMAGLVGK